MSNASLKVKASRPTPIRKTIRPKSEPDTEPLSLDGRPPMFLPIWNQCLRREHTSKVFPPRIPRPRATKGGLAQARSEPIALAGSKNSPRHCPYFFPKHGGARGHSLQLPVSVDVRRPLGMGLGSYEFLSLSAKRSSETKEFARLCAWRSVGFLDLVQFAAHLKFSEHLVESLQSTLSGYAAKLTSRLASLPLRQCTSEDAEKEVFVLPVLHRRQKMRFCLPVLLTWRLAIPTAT